MGMKAPVKQEDGHLSFNINPIKEKRIKEYLEDGDLSVGDLSDDQSSSVSDIPISLPMHLRNNILNTKKFVKFDKEN